MLLAIGNFLSYLVQDDRGRFRTSYSLDSKTVSTTSTLDDQLAAIRALLKSSEILRNDLHRWVAIDGYFALNHNFWRTEKGFYSENDKAPSFRQLTEMAYIFRELKAFLPNASRPQLDKMGEYFDRAIAR